MTWQLIKTAPKDGSLVLVGKAGSVNTIAKWSNSWVEPYLDTIVLFAPTHWQPIPDFMLAANSATGLQLVRLGLAMMGVTYDNITIGDDTGTTQVWP